jgi:hypothetical protein
MATQTLTVGSSPTLAIDHIGGDLVVRGQPGTELEAQGDDLHELEQHDSAVNISSGGDLNLSVPRGAALKLGFVGGDVTLTDLDGSIEISFVGGDAHLSNLTGPVSLAGLVGGDTQMENVSRISMDANRSGLGPDVSAKIRRKAREAEQKIRRAEAKIRRAAERRAGHGEHRPHVNVDLGRWKWNVTPGSFTPGAIGETVSDEERMAILKMLQDKKITAEQAEKLLAALEGGS